MSEETPSVSVVGNPYQSPSSISPSSALIDGVAGAPITAVLTQSSALRRQWELSGGVEATLGWNASWVTEFVTLNGRRVASHQPIFFAPLFEFDVVASYGVIAGAVEIRLSRYVPVFVRGIRVRMDGAIIYQEGRW